MVSSHRPSLRCVAPRRSRPRVTLVFACSIVFALSSPLGVAADADAQSEAAAEPSTSTAAPPASTPPAETSTPNVTSTPADDESPRSDSTVTDATDVVVSPVLSAETDEFTPRAETLSRLLLEEFRARGLELIPGAEVVPPEGSTLPLCPNLDCFQAMSSAASARFVIAGTLSRQSKSDVLELVAYDAKSGRLRGRVRQTGRGESDFVGRTTEIVTQLLADAGLESAEKIVFIDVVKLGIPSTDPLERSNTARSFPILIVGGGVGAAVGVGLFGIALLFGLTANANHGSALEAATQIDAAAFVDQRDINGFVANSLFLVGTSFVVAGGVVAALGYEWGE